MKYIRILTFKLVSLTLIAGSGSLLPISSAYAQDSQSTKNPTSNISPSPGEKKDAKPLTNSVKPPTESNEQQKPEPGGSTSSTTSTSSSSVKSRVENDSSGSIISFITLFLSILNTAGLGILFFLNKKVNETISDTKKDVKSANSKLSDDIKSLKSGNHVVESRISKIDSDNQKNLAEIKRKTEDLQHTIASVSQKSTSRSTDRIATRERDVYAPSPLEYQPVELTNNQPSCISRYNNRAHNFQDNYQLISVDREAENYKLSRSAKTEDVILEKQSQGGYWMFLDNGKNLVVPKHTFKIRQGDLNEVQSLFECLDYRDDTHNNFVLIEPAVLTQQGSGTWQLKEKGKLQFS